ncbi:Predicted Zn-dependent peptidase [Polaribacter sp. Hel1_33_78]|jgi:zinc protease|uniref:M16 family metallopeptidase n=1 Tax=unclassified Polaribacter TaxID=196858 RepID=UPI00087BF2A2|nr:MULTISPECIES: pitrilysin family protein [unclassified Polaribacter]MBT3741803.1 insulinase family protein [Polaribacter sp.]MBT4413089.1 insulinase family protein [Polaribacter sp.]MBT7815678.1 insulinase family protein [Polaribacter sp.]MDG1196042.1 pitrilysin family protein [Polaribacter sp.]MDG1403789.1 pitrilysin family protein [Polaribacter sp.]
MKKSILSLASAMLFVFSTNAQKVEFEEYNLDNGMHVILHQDDSAPVVTVAVMYHVGAKDEVDGKTGMAHFYEHLLFTGTKNIDRGKWSEITSARGGTGNANTNWDRTYYYQTFPSNELKLALWMEAERLSHPIIDQKAVDTQNEVVKEEKRQRMDNAPYGKVIYGDVYSHIFDNHNYGRPMIGYIKDLDAAKLEEFQAFYNKWYMPNNAVLVVAGDFEKGDAKSIINDYFASIPARTKPERNKVIEPERTSEKRVVEYDANIQLPLLGLAYKTPAMSERDAKVLDVISTVLSNGKSSRLYKKLVDDKKMALQAFSFSRPLEDYSVYIIGSIVAGGTSNDDIIKEMDEEILKLQTELISDKDLQKVRNKFENQFVASNSSVTGIANSLARNYMLVGDTDRINKELEIINSITKEEVRDVAIKYLAKNRRVIMDYLPESQKK